MTTKKTDIADKKPRKKYIKLTKEMVSKIIDKGMDNSKSISKDFNLSSGTANKILGIIRKTNWTQKTEKDNLPNGYFIPKSVEEIVNSVMWDKGFTKE